MVKKHQRDYSQTYILVITIISIIYTHSTVKLIGKSVATSKPLLSKIMQNNYFSEGLL